MYQEIHIKGRKSRLHLFAAAFYLAYFMLTKVFFAYVAAIVLLCVGLFYVFKKVSSAKKTVGVYSLAFLFCLPYLIYTFSLTGKIFYWSTYGGSSLYWMSSPYSEEKGDWLGNKLNQLEEHAKKYGSKELIQNHGQLFESLKELDNVKANEKLKEKAIRNIINHPVKFTKNWFANVGRLIWDFPYSYTQQKLSTFFYLFPNMFIVVFALLCLFPTLYCNEKISGSILYLLFFALVSFLASTVLSAYPRQLIPIVPFIVLWIFYVLTRLVTIRICKMELFQ
jgi:hypothetical protein